MKTLQNRASAHCTYANDGLVEQKRVSRALMKNGYPKRVTQQRMGTAIRNQMRQESNPRATVTIPYVRGTSEAIRRVLAPLDIGTQIHPTTTLRRLNSSTCQGPGPHGNDNWCGVPDWMSGLCSHLCGTDWEVTTLAGQKWVLLETTSSK